MSHSISSSSDIKGFYDVEGNKVKFHSKNINCFFQDLQSAMDKGAEDTTVFLLYLWPVIYGIVDDSDNLFETSRGRYVLSRIQRTVQQWKAKPKSATASMQKIEKDLELLYEPDSDVSDVEEFEELIQEYYFQMDSIEIFRAMCRTLTCAAGQQKAYERQLGINGKVSPKILPDNIKESFFLNLYDEAKQYQCFSTKLRKETCIRGYKELYRICSEQPLPAMLLPAILTIYSTDGILFRNIYSYFKYKRRRLSAESQRQIMPLFSAISSAVDAQMQDFHTFYVPVFFWEEICDVFCQHNRVPEKDRATVSYYFDKLCVSNGLPKSQEQILIKYEYGEKLRALAKIFNLNVYITLNYSENKICPQLAKKPYQMLEAGELLPRKQIEGNDLKYNNLEFDEFLSDFCYKVRCNPDFSRMMIFRCYRLPISYLSGGWPEFYGRLREEFDRAMYNHLSKIRNKWNRDQDVRVITSEPENNWLNERSAARSAYDTESAMRNLKYMTKAKSFGKQVIATFTDQDYREFIANQNNFICYYFPRYLKKFCIKYRLNSYLDANSKESCVLEDEAFFSILSLVHERLLSHFEAFWQKSIEMELYEW